MPLELNELERAVMEMLLAGDDPALAVLATQFCLANAARREFTGVGFYIDFDVPPDAPRLVCRNAFHIADVDGDISGLQHGAMFVLHGCDGVITYLEGVTLDEPWPDAINGFVLSYMSGGARDMDRLRKELTCKS